MVWSFSAGENATRDRRKAYDETAKALKTSAVQGKLSALGVDPMLMSPKEFDAFIEREIAANSDLVKAAGMKPN
ncbi:MAG: hypothetical protein ACJ8EE_14730 [Bradyrhizobium sp.]